MALMLRILCILAFISLHSFAQNKADSLMKELETADSKSVIFNLLAEAWVDDSLELSEEYALKALEFAAIENNTREEGVAWFNLGEVNSYGFRYDSAVSFYSRALDLFKKTGDDYYVSYTLNNLGWLSNMYGRYDTAVSYYFESIKYIDREKHADDLAYVYINLGNASHHLGKYHTAINYFQKSISLLSKFGDSSALAYAYNGMGLAYKFHGNFDSAAFYYNAMLKIDKKTGKPHDLAVDYGNLGALYAEWKQYDLALGFQKHALQLYLSDGLKSDLATTYNNIGQIHQATGQYDSALFYLNTALDLDRETGMQNYMAVRYNNIGDVYFRKKNYRKALDNYEQAMAINKLSGDRYSLARNLANMAKTYNKTGMPEKAEKLFFESLELAKGIKSKTLEKDILAEMSGFYGETSRYKKAMFYDSLADQLTDSLFREKTLQNLTDLQTKYELDKKESKINALSKEKEMQSLLLRTYRIRNYYLAGGIILSAIVLTVLIIQYRSRQKAYKKLLEKNMELVEGQRSEDRFVESEKTDTGAVMEQKKFNEELYKKIVHYMKEEKPYLRPDLTVKEMADELNSNTHYISDVINQNFGNNFTQFINEYRVKEACRMLLDPNNDHLSIEGIAVKAGFKSKSVFNNAFKSITGLTPSYYKKRSGMS